MGKYFKFGCVDKKEYIDLNSLKIGEIIRDGFSMNLIVQWLSMDCIYESHCYKFLDDESGEWDKLIDEKWRNVTSDVLIDMFEDGFIPNSWQLKFVIEAFQEAKKLAELSKWLIEFDKKEGSKQSIK